ncbi:11408_t:CDS:1, partial [Acaulospora colombiana]
SGVLAKFTRTQQPFNKQIPFHLPSNTAAIMENSEYPQMPGRIRPRPRRDSWSNADFSPPSQPYGADSPGGLQERITVLTEQKKMLEDQVRMAQRAMPDKEWFEYFITATANAAANQATRRIPTQGQAGAFPMNMRSRMPLPSATEAPHLRAEGTDIEIVDFFDDLEQ